MKLSVKFGFKLSEMTLVRPISIQLVEDELSDALEDFYNLMMTYGSLFDNISFF